MEFVTDINQQALLWLYDLGQRVSIVADMGVLFDIVVPVGMGLAGLLVLLRRYKRWRFAAYRAVPYLYVSGIAGLAYLGAWAIKAWRMVPRPFEVLNIVPLVTASGYSFPSMHAATLMGFALAMGRYHKHAGYIMVLLAIMGGLARVVAGVHYPMDVLVGWVLGWAVARIVGRIWR